MMGGLKCHPFCFNRHFSTQKVGASRFEVKDGRGRGRVRERGRKGEGKGLKKKNGNLSLNNDVIL